MLNPKVFATRFALIIAQHDAFRLGDLETASRLLHLLNRRRISVGLADDAGFKAECIAQECGCKIRYSRCFNRATISF